MFPNLQPNSKLDTEFEVKFYPVDKDSFRTKLRSVSARIIFPERKMRRIITDQRENPQLTSDYVRIRDEGKTIRLSTKTHAKNGRITDQKEINIEVSDFDNTKRILEASGIKFHRYQETLRETWEYKEAEIVIDTWPGLKPYVEIESGSEESLKSISKKLGFDWRTRIVVPAPEIYMRVYGLTDIKALEMMSNLTFENNPFKDLPVKWTGK